MSAHSNPNPTASRWIVSVLFLLVFPPQAYSQIDLIDNIFNKVSDIQGKVNDIRSNVRTSATELADGLQTLGQDMRDEIAAASEEISATIEETRNDRQEFLANAAQFRTDLANMLLNFETLSEAISQFTGLPVTFEFQRERQLIGNLPDRAMGPLFRALASEDGAAFTEFVNRVEQAAASANLLARAIIGDCSVAMSDPQAVVDASSSVAKIGGSTKLIGKGLIARGATGISGKPVQVWGFAGVEIVNNRKRKWGERLDGLADLLLAISSVAGNKLRYCSIVDGTERILDELGNLNLDLTNLDSPISSRASQASVNAIRNSLSSDLDAKVSSRASQSSVMDVQTSLGALGASISSRASQSSVDTLAGSLGTLNAANLDVAVSSRASESSLENLAALLDEDGAFRLQLFIEEQLGHRGQTLSTLYLPSMHGGLLELVRQVVSGVIDQNGEAGIPTGRARFYLSEGDGAQASSDFKRAFERYQRAYEAVVR